MPSIEVQRLRKQFSSTTGVIFSDLSFSVSSNESLCLLGPSGCGKTTLLRLLMDLEKPTSGTIHIAHELRKHMSYVFQEPRLVPWRTCLENVLLPLELTAQNGPDARERALELLQQLGLSDRLQHFPSELSGGMQMRVALARALVIHPKIILLDEPFAALDERSRFRMQDLLLDLKSRLNLQYVFVTHSISEAVYLGDRILLLDNGGCARDWRSIQFPQRNQMLKMTPSFNSIVEIYAQLFNEIELNRSEPVAQRKIMMKSKFKNLMVERLPAWIFLLLLLLIWQYVVTKQWVAPYLLPSPLQIFHTTVELWPEIAAATLSTLQSIIWGLGLSVLLGVATALLFYAIPIARRAILPFCIFFQTVPIISIAPLLVIWFGFGQPTVRASAFIVSIFPILANTLTGLEETDPQLKELFALYKPSTGQLIFKLQIPSALPYILTGIKISAGLAVIGAIVGEFIAGGGLGSLIDAARTQQRVDLVFSGVLMSSGLALLLVLIIGVASRLLLRGRPYLRKA